MNISPRASSPRSGSLPALPMVSMIDVVFLLLIFFMVTASFAEDEEQLAAALAAEGKSAAKTDLQPQIIKLTLREGLPTFTIGTRSTTSRDALRAVLTELPKDPGVVVRVSNDVPVWSITAALQSAADAGFTKRSYVPAND